MQASSLSPHYDLRLKAQTRFFSQYADLSEKRICTVMLTVKGGQHSGDLVLHVLWEVGNSDESQTMKHVSSQRRKVKAAWEDEPGALDSKSAPVVG